MKKKICVYSSSSNLLDDIYYKDASEIGTLIGKHGFDFVYGGGNLGSMYSAAKQAKKFGAKIYGVIPEKLNNLVISDHCDELFLTKTMRERKDKMDRLSDHIIALAGGYGTLEELSEMIVQKQLGYNNKAIVILNTNGFYNDLLNFFEKIEKENFAKTIKRKFYYVANTPKEAIEYILNYNEESTDITKELLEKIGSRNYNES